MQAENEQSNAETENLSPDQLAEKEQSKAYFDCN
jgi:hypothetical protein